MTDKRHHRFYHKSDGSDADLLSSLRYDDSKTFRQFRPHAEGGYDDEGWLYPGDRLVNSMQSIVDAITHGIEPKASGQVQHKSFEATVAMRGVRAPGPCSGQTATTRPQPDAQASDMAMGEQERTLRRGRVRPANRPRDQLLGGLSQLEYNNPNRSRSIPSPVVGEG